MGAPIASIYSTGTTVSSGYPIFVSKDTSGTMVVPSGNYLWTGTLWVAALGDANGNAQVSLTGSNTKSVTLANAVTSTGVQVSQPVGQNKTLLIEVYGTATSFTLQVQGISTSGSAYALTGVNTSNLTFNQNITAAGVYQFDVTGLVNVQADITAVSGGNVSAAGELVAS